MNTIWQCLNGNSTIVGGWQTRGEQVEDSFSDDEDDYWPGLPRSPSMWDLIHSAAEDEQSWWTEPPAQLQPPHPALSVTRRQHPLPRDPSLPPRYRRERFRLIPPTNPWEFYEQRKEMIARHHWKLTNQDMTPMNSLRCTRMLMKHHWTLFNFIRGLADHGQTEHQLLDWLVREHAVLLDTSRFVLCYFELVRLRITLGLRQRI